MELRLFQIQFQIQIWALFFVSPKIIIIRLKVRRGPINRRKIKKWNRRWAEWKTRNSPSLIIYSFRLV